MVAKKILLPTARQPEGLCYMFVHVVDKNECIRKTTPAAGQFRLAGFSVGDTPMSKELKARRFSKGATPVDDPHSCSLADASGFQCGGKRLRIDPN
jgi:hypothetical protein